MTDREIIVNILQKVIYDHAYASLSLKQIESSENQGLITTVVYGCLRHYSLLKYQYTGFTKKVKKRMEVILLMSLFQHHFLDSIPDYAIVNEACNLVKKPERAFINAILRRCFQEPLHYPKQQDPLYLAIRYSHPAWLIHLWQKQYGLEQCLAILEENQKPSRVYARHNGLLGPKVEGEGIQYYEGDCLSYEGNILEHPYFKEARWIIQDRHSQQVVRHLDLKEKMKVLDSCAAPGTKSQQIACLMKNQGILISCDIYSHRLKLIEELAIRSKATCIQTKLQDASVLVEEWVDQFDRILVDAPCSGLGDLAHKPEIRWHVDPSSLDELEQLQASILDCQSKYLKEDGILVYSTCTLNKKENEKQILRFMEQHPEFELLEEETLFPREGSDGFYFAKLRRNKKDMIK